MPQISENAMVLLIQLLDERISVLENLVKNSDENAEELADYEDELLLGMAVEEELRTAYEEALKGIGNLPTYSDITPHRRIKTVD